MGIISDAVWNGNTLSCLSGVGPLAMKNNLILSLGSSSLFLLRRNVTEGGKDI